MIVLMLMTVALVAGLCVLAYTLAFYALPFMLGVEVARWAYASGSGLIGAGLVGLVTGAVAYGLLIVLFMAVRPPILRLAVALAFAVPAAVAGYAMVHGITREAVPSEVWRTIFCLIGGGVTGLSALMRFVGDVNRDK
ncbi:hypothetical protein N5K10_06725 [Agrobacterium sp. GD03638]|nr:MULTISPECIES: hypothetical protein [unclassified Agrobacterium]MDH0612680.1 hypothetical protein [Agrobacterium sp. GD03872]MDH2209347.1 hypothetical protein [Agrobacterium sp. GD03643]MDH2218838.1 hypothetical protein [Agrobacterium sp. GD03638]MDH2223023.1 hypothetical protein [Agrobacterium sp. GD03642]